MLICRNCGQSPFIDDEYFIEYADVSGVETRYLNSKTGDVEDYGDNDSEGTGDSRHECPYCSGSDIDWNWEGEEEEALELRRRFDESRAAARKEIEKNKLASSIKNSEWDLESNEVHK